MKCGTAVRIVWQEWTVNDMRLIDVFRNLFCKHDWEKEIITGGFLVVDGWLVNPVQYRCRVCGKVISAAGAMKDGDGK
jgi:hypothetical protein